MKDNNNEFYFKLDCIDELPEEFEEKQIGKSSYYEEDFRDD